MGDLVIMPNLLDRRRLKDRIIESISKAVKNIQLLESGNSGGDQEQDIVLSNSDWQFCKLVEHLDHAFLHGLRHVSTGYWAVAKEFTHKSTVKEITLLTKVITDLGRSRAWLYQALVDHLLESYIRCYLDNSKIVKTYYVQDALVLDEQQLQIMLTLSSGIERVRFELELDVPYLDLSAHQPRSPMAVPEKDDDDNISLRSMSSSMSFGVSQDACQGIGRSPSSGSLQLPVFSSVNNALDTEVEVIHISSNSKAKKPARKRQAGRQKGTITPTTPLTPESGYRSIVDDLPSCGSVSDVSTVQGQCTLVEASHSTPVSISSMQQQYSGFPRNVSSSSLKIGAETSCELPKQDLRIASNSSPVPSAANLSSNSRPTTPVSLFSTSASTIVTRTAAEDDLLMRILDDRNASVKAKKLAASSQPCKDVNIEGVSSSAALPSILVSPCDDNKRASSSECVAEIDEDAISVYDFVAPDKESHNNPVAVTDSQQTLPLTGEELSIHAGLTAQNRRSATGRNSRSASPNPVDESSPCEKVLSDANNIGEPGSEIYMSSRNCENSTEFSFSLTPQPQNCVKSDAMPQSADKTSDANLSSKAAVSLSSSSSDFSAQPENFVEKPKPTVSRSPSVASTVSLDNIGHPYEVRVDNNLKLFLMLEIFQFDGEKFMKMYRSSTGHTEGELRPISLVITDHALYILYGANRTTYKKKAVIRFQEIDYISLSLNSQVVNIVCKTRRKQFWICTGDEQLTGMMLETFDKAVRVNDSSVQSLSVLNDATTQKIAIRKHAAKECKVEMPDVTILGYFLVHWEDAMSFKASNLHIGNGGKEGILLVKSYNYLFGGSCTWTQAYFVLRDGVLYQYEGMTNRSNVCSTVSLSGGECRGCRRSPRSDRNHCFEINFTHGSPLELAALNASDECEWINALCLAATNQSDVHYYKGAGCIACCCIVTQDRLFICHEDVQTNLIRTLSSVPIALMITLYTDAEADTYCVLAFESVASKAVRREKWAMYFISALEKQKFSTTLMDAFESKVKKPLHTELLDGSLAARCREGILKLNQLHMV